MNSLKQVRTNYSPDADRARSNANIFRARIFCLLKTNESLDLQVFRRIGKAMKTLQWYFDNVYIPDDRKTDLFDYELWNT